MIQFQYSLAHKPIPLPYFCLPQSFQSFWSSNCFSPRCIFWVAFFKPLFLASQALTSGQKVLGFKKLTSNFVIWCPSLSTLTTGNCSSRTVLCNLIISSDFDCFHLTITEIFQSKCAIKRISSEFFFYHFLKKCVRD